MIRENYGPRFWESPQRIESYCTESAGVLLAYLDAMFEDLKGSIYFGTQRSDITSKSTLEAHRVALDRTGRLTRLVKMQLEVIGRVMDRKQEELKGLVSEKSVHISNAND